jgi:phosphoglycolate phosphatase-like HAD superfamily hydrolase
MARMFGILRHLCVAILCFGAVGLAQAADPLPSWNEGANKQAVLHFVADVTHKGGPRYVAPAERIAVFDNDGTLWSEQPLYFQFIMFFEQIKADASKHPEWKDNPALKALQANDLPAAFKDMKALETLVVGVSAGQTVGEYNKRISDWLATARHPKFNKPYTELVFQPQLELLKYLRASGFKTYIVSGGGIDFMRVWAEKVYGIPPEQVVGSSQVVKYEVRDGKAALVRQAQVDFVDDGPGKPVGIYRNIGRWPILAFGNSDGDLQMLQTAAGHPGGGLALIVHHDDAEREYAYDRQSSIGKLDKALDQASTDGWVVVSMKKDWKRIFPGDK